MTAERRTQPLTTIDTPSADRHLCEALAATQRLLETSPDVVATAKAAFALAEAGAPREAKDILERIAGRGPVHPVVLNNLGVVLAMLGDAEASRDRFLGAIELHPAMAEAHSNLGFWERRYGSVMAAMARYGLALACDPDFREARMNRALLDLATGDLRSGWRDYLHRPVDRRNTGDRPSRPWPASLEGAPVIVVGEQGFGDELFFLRFAPEVVRRGARVTVVVSPEIGALIDPMIAEFSIVRRVSPDQAQGARLVHLGDLPFLLDATDMAALPPPLPLRADPARRAASRATITRDRAGPVLALTWRAGLRGSGHLDKSLPIETIAAMAAQWVGPIVSIQRQTKAGEIAALEQALDRRVTDLGALNDSLPDMLALLAEIDAYLGVSNTNMHLRASLGLAMDVCVPHPPEFRWMMEGDRSPWFPQACIHRQASPGDWLGVVDTVRASLTERAGAAP